MCKQNDGVRSQMFQVHRAKPVGAKRFRKFSCFDCLFGFTGDNGQ